MKRFIYVLVAMCVCVSSAHLRAELDAPYQGQAGIRLVEKIMFFAERNRKDGVFVLPSADGNEYIEHRFFFQDKNALTKEFLPRLKAALKQHRGVEGLLAGSHLNLIKKNESENSVVYGLSLVGAEDVLDVEIFKRKAEDYALIKQVTEEKIQAGFTNNFGGKYGVSIVIPTFNRLSEVTACVMTLIARIQAPKNQWEIVVVDDGSTEGNGNFFTWLKAQPNIAINANIKVVWSDKETGTYRNAGWSRNAGLQAAQFPIVAFCDTAMLHFTDPVTPTLAYFSDPRNRATFLHGKMFRVEDKGSAKKNNQRMDVKKSSVKSISAGWQTTWRSTLLAVGGFDQRYEKYWGVEDRELWKRLMALGYKEYKHPMILYGMPYRGPNKHKRSGDGRAHYGEILKTDPTLERNIGVEWGKYSKVSPDTEMPSVFRSALKARSANMDG